MICSKCGEIVPEQYKFCPKCGMRVEKDESSLSIKHAVDDSIRSKVPPDNIVIKNDVVSNAKGINKKKLCIIGGTLVLIIFITMIILLFNLLKPDRSEILTAVDKSKYVSFKIDDNIYYIGDMIHELRADGIDYDTKFSQDIVYSDSISTRTFSNEKGVNLFLAALYCSKKEDCNHSETVLVKANFYEDSKVVVNGFVKFGVKYDEIVEKYGKEDGRFYQDQELYVWTFDDKNEVGSPYMVLRFNKGSLFSSSGVSEIRLGVFWYEGEAEHIIVPSKEVEEK